MGAQLMEVTFPGSSRTERRFDLRFIELAERTPTRLGEFAVSAYEVPHPSGAPAYAFRLAVDGKLLAYSGDAAWTEALVEVADGADLFICEAYCFGKLVPHHLSYATIRQHRARMACGRLILTHMGPEMLARRDEAEDECAEDGLTLTL